MRTTAIWPAALILLAGAAGCASTSAAARPSPFPGRAPAWAAPAVDRVMAGSVLTRALALRGTPYRFGGDRPDSGLDCSGLVRHVYYEEAQILLPRTVVEQFRVGAGVDTREIQAGDLVFFDTVEPGPSHVGIALDADTFVHAPGTGGVVRVDRLVSPYWSSRFRGARRVAGVVPVAPGVLQPVRD
jgi:cell wall-associated NlpC family hydrolase